MKAKSQGVRFALAGMLGLAAMGAHAESTLYLQPNFTGKSMTLRGVAPNLSEQGFADQVSSIVIPPGSSWQFCTQPDFKGDCETLGPGRYATLHAGLNHRIESAREIVQYADRWNDGLRGRYAADGGSIILYDGTGFRGQRLALSGASRTLRREGFDNQAESIVVEDGFWQVCTEPNFGGECRVIGPGEYRNLRDTGFSNNISSLRPARDPSYASR
jgi:hypothetical protein